MENNVQMIKNLSKQVTSEVNGKSKNEIVSHDDKTKYYDKSSTEYTINIAVVGDTNTGKSSLIQRFLNKKYDITKMQPTVVDYYNTVVQYDDEKKLKVGIWDTSGKERTIYNTQSYIRTYKGFILVFDLYNIKTLNDTKNWLDMITSEFKRESYKIPIVLIGNKEDKQDTLSSVYLTQFAPKLITEKQIDTFFDEYEDKNQVIECIVYYECSAVTNKNVDDAFYYLLSYIAKNKEKMKLPQSIASLSSSSASVYSSSQNE